MTDNTLIFAKKSPKRWAIPFGEISDEDISYLLTKSNFKNIKADIFPPHTSIKGILKNDCRIRDYAPGDIVIRDGDYGGSAFYIIEGDLRVIQKPNLPEAMLGRSTVKKRGIFAALDQLFKNPITEYRNLEQTTGSYSSGKISNVNLLNSSLAKNEFTGAINPDTGIPALSSKYESTLIPPNILIGEIAALGRTPRTATVYSETPAKILEIRWQGLRDIRLYDRVWKKQIDDKYQENILKTLLQYSPYFSRVDQSVRETIIKEKKIAFFESYGSFDWSHTFKSSNDHTSDISSEPVIAHQGDYADAVYFIAAGFARISQKFGNSRRTLSYLRAGDIFAYDELFEDYKNPKDHPKLKMTLSALGYVHILKFPVSFMKEYIFPHEKSKNPKIDIKSLAKRSVADNSLLEWAVQERFSNGTKVMLINQDRCVRCDDCVTACSNGHNNNPRFIRHGKTIGKWLVTNACMHCTDPVCMIGCPTGAINRLKEGTVVINDATCIGCATCANSCPYSNIRMVDIRDKKGRVLLDQETGYPIQKATKCDLCVSQPGGPACVRACPHDALKRVDFQTEIHFS